MVTDVLEMIYELQRAHGANQKKNVLLKYADSEDFRQFLYYALNPRLTYKVSEATLRAAPEYNPAVTLCSTNIFEICETLSQRKALDNATTYQVQAFLSFIQDEDERETYIKLLAKTLRLGVTAKTVNKVIPGLIPEWEIQQAYPIEKYPLKEGVWFALTQKLNGVRATYYKGRLYARSGEPYTGLEHILNDLNFEQAEGMVFDGELTLKHREGVSDNEAFREATGIINSDAMYKTEVCYTIFDVLPEYDFEQGESVATYRVRREYLDWISTHIPSNGNVSVLPTLYSGTDQEMIPQLLDQMVREDKEGLMVNLDVKYKCKRHNGILKVKRFYTMDLPIIGYEEGTGRLEGTLGALVLDYKGNQVKVGSGFSDEQRYIMWSHRQDLLQTLCEVKYKEISSDKRTGAESLQFPVFVRLRADKGDVSYG